jgi:signal transduction histidine kinase
MDSILMVSSFLATLIFLIIGVSLHNAELQYNKLQVKKSIEQIKSNENALKQHTKLVAMGEMIGLIAHQWRQPLATSNIIVSTLQAKNQLDCLDKDYLTKKLYDIEQSNLYMSQTIEDFLRYFAPQKDKELFAPCEAVKQALNLMDNLLKKHHIKITKEIEQCGTILGHKDEYIQVVLTLITNAIQAFKNQEEKKIFIKSFKRKGTFYLEIADNAGGVEQKNINRIFEPYFTTKHQTQGTGLGLYMAKMIIEKNMKGSLTVQNEKDGAKFLIQSKLENKNG